MVYGPKNADAGSGLSSGYEKSIFSLAWKWALSKVQNNRTLLMDEVDSAASQKNSLIFYRTIGDSMKLFDQILIVSHKEQTRELLENEYNARVFTFVDGEAI
jgi:DNA repair ATPase RecN